MPIKTILLHMTNDEQHMARLEVGLELARRFDAHLEILYIATPVSMPASATGRGASYAYLAEATAIAHERAIEIRREVEARCSKGCTHSWRTAEGDHVALLAERSVFADLAIVSQSHGVHLEDRVRLHLPDQLPLQAACPTLVLPWRPRPATVGTRVLVAWKNSREASRALRDSLAFLAGATAVTVLTIEDPDADTTPGPEMVAFLARHGVTAEHRRNLSDEGEIGEILLAVGHEIGADTLVMGAYGHSRLRELIMGGATRHVLSHMDLPVLMSH